MIVLRSDGVSNAKGTNCHVEVEINDIGEFYVYPVRKVFMDRTDTRVIAYYAIRSRTAKSYYDRYNFIQGHDERVVKIMVFEVSEFLDGNSSELEKHISDVIDEDQTVVGVLDELDPPLMHDIPAIPSE